MLKKLFKILLNLFSFEPDPVFYITNGAKALPEKLTEDEELYIINQVKLGNQYAKAELIERNLRLVVYIAQKFENTKLNIDDLTSVGTIGLIKAVKFFNADKQIKFATFASRCIENEILMFLRKNNKVDVSLDEPLSTDKDGNELVLGDLIGTDSEIVYKSIESKVEIEILAELINRLPPREKFIMKLRYGLADTKEYTQKEVADKLNISQSYISRIEKKVLLKLKGELTVMC